MNQQHSIHGTLQLTNNRPYLPQGQPLPKPPRKDNDPENQGQRKHNHDHRQPTPCGYGWLSALFCAILAILATVFRDLPLPPLTPLQNLQSRSLLNNHNIYHLQSQAAALRAPLNMFHMEEEMTLYRFYISTTELYNSYILEGIENVTLCVEHLIDISAREMEEKINLGEVFQEKVRVCEVEVERIISITRRGLDSHDRVITFIENGLKGSTQKAGEKYGSKKSSPIKRSSVSYNTTIVSPIGSLVLGWHTYLSSSLSHWTDSKSSLFHTLARLSRFAAALQAMKWKKVEGLTADLVWEEVNDRAALCRSFEVVRQRGSTAGDGITGSWILAAQSIEGDVYLGWWEGI